MYCGGSTKGSIAREEVSMSKRAVVYCRISLDATGQGLGIARQEEACRKRCDERGWEVVEVIADNSISASSGKRRPGWSKVLDLIESRAVDVVVAWQVDRMYRSPRDLEDLVDLSERTGVTLATVSGDLDLTTPNGRLVARLLGATARQEVEIKSERQKAAHLQRAKSGKPWWNARPFGFERNGSHREDEATALRQAYTDVLNGSSIYSVAAAWNRSGMLTPKGNPWRSSNLRHVLMNPRNAAIHTYVGDETGQPATWEPIVSEDIYRAVTRLLSDPARIPGGGGRRKGLLTGVAECSKCGGKVLQGNSRANSKGERYRIYTCGTGRCITIPADFLESFVMLRVTEYADQWIGLLGGGHEVDEAELAGLRAEEQALAQRRQELAELFGDGLVDRSALAAGTEKMNARLTEIGDRLAEIADSRGGDGIVGDTEYIMYMFDRMATEDVERLRAIIVSVTESIRLMPRGKGTRDTLPEHVQIRFRTRKSPPVRATPRAQLPQSWHDAWDEAEGVTTPALSDGR
jgi:site-specific DNA recombinase